LLGLTVGLGAIAVLLGITAVVLNWRAVKSREAKDQR
jgi:hypothetical protein